MTPPSFRSVQEVYGHLLSFANAEKGQTVEFKLDRMREIAARLGNPQSARPCLHVAGSKGKGSVSTMLASILESSGRETGLYTSPHVADFRERITSAGEFYPDEVYLAAFAELALLAPGPEAFPPGQAPTFFELATLLAFLVFRSAGCAAAVYETGLGGRLDSTNIVEPEASVLTPIELEHTEYLGSTITAIAGEKAGIIKPGRPAFTSALDPSALEVFRRTAEARGSPLRILSEEVVISEVRVARSGTEALAVFRDREVFPEPVVLRSPMIGEVQAGNAALAALTARLSTFRAPPQAVLDGIARAALPARFQILPGEPPVVLDGAHTPASMAYTAGTFSRFFPGPAVLVFACAGDKRAREMAETLAGQFRRAIVTRPGTFKKSDPAAAAAGFAAAGFEVDRIDDTEQALREGLRRAGDAGLPLLVAGSFFLCAEALSVFRDRIREGSPRS
ncbi:MAG TPA: Mur ligase family protein [Magnetospirillaceae bacterium]|nr:Mur ligase family protein [Magnetospirillaceae bacterium]